MACEPDLAPRLVGSFAGTENWPFDDIAVNPARDTLYATLRNAGGGADGLYRFTYPGLVNMQGAGVRWFATGANEDWEGLAVDAAGNVYVASKFDDGVTFREDMFHITPAGVKTTWATRARTGSGQLTGYRMAWNAMEAGVLAVGKGAGASGGSIVKVTAGGFVDLEAAVVAGGSTCLSVTPDGATWFIGTIGGTSHVVRRPAGGPSANVGITNIASGAVLVCGQPDDTFLFQDGVAYDGKASTTGLAVSDDDRADAVRVFASHTSVGAEYATFHGTGAGHNDDIYELHTCPAVVEPPPPPPVSASAGGGGLVGCVLGCEDPRVYLMDFCGSKILCDLTDSVSFVKCGLELDDDSECEVTLHISGDASGRACCECLEGTRTWRHEIMVIRGGEVIWGPGPIVTITIGREIAHLVARDVVAWLDVRAVHSDYSFVGVDVSTIARTVIEDALTGGDAALLPRGTQDACILGLASFTPAQRYTDLTVAANTQTAGEILRNLATQGLDFTVRGRSLIVGGQFAFGPIGPLLDEHFAGEIEIAEHGLAAATKWHEHGNSAYGSCGGIDPYYGLIEKAVEGASSSSSAAVLDALACDRLAASNPPPLTVSVPSGSQLTPTAPVCPAVLVPGSLVDIAIREMCRGAFVRERLTAVEYRFDENGEAVGVTVAQLGEQALAAQGG